MLVVHGSWLKGGARPGPWGCRGGELGSGRGVGGGIHPFTRHCLGGLHLPLTRQHTDIHPCTRPPSWETRANFGDTSVPMIFPMNLSIKSLNDKEKCSLGEFNVLGCRLASESKMEKSIPICQARLVGKGLDVFVVRLLCR